ncbi:TniQ family protein [Actinoplanes sp. NPDC024001]|uniref:TniQ family protein n=1 Tax=Actinoplanes sp. NPDC024001 TaxID=3154598 RepID=UPI0033F14DFB
MTTVRVLPRSLVPLADESISGFLLRLAHRLSLTPSRLVVSTGLDVRTDRYRQRLAPVLLLVNVEPDVLRTFAHSASLTETEARSLFLAGYSDRYPPARGPHRVVGSKVSRHKLDGWLSVKFTRYCPECLAGDGSPIQRELGGAWKRAWRLPAVFACPIHRRYLHHRCAAGHVAHQQENGFLPRWSDYSLHPTQCRSHLRQRRHQRQDLAPACGAWLTETPAQSPPNAAALALQRKILQALDPTAPDKVTVAGQPVTAAEYFWDLFKLSHAVLRAWPLSRHLLSDATLADALEQYVSEVEQQVTTRCKPGSKEHNLTRHAAHRTPPPDAMACAAMLLAADTMLSHSSPRELANDLRYLLRDDEGPLTTADWNRRFLEGMPENSLPFGHALTLTRQTIVRVRRPRRRPAVPRWVKFGPEHVPQFLEPDWYQRFFARFDGVATKYLRRTAALRVVQIVAGCGVREAAVKLGLPGDDSAYSRCATTVLRVNEWAAGLDNPHAFDDAVYDLIDHINGLSHRIDYDRRRKALRDWCITPKEWRALVAQMPQQADLLRPPDFGDRKRQAASIVVWTRLTHGEHRVAPQPIRDQQPADEHLSWRSSTDTLFNRLRTNFPGEHYQALGRVLQEYASELAARIDSPQGLRRRTPTGRR